MNISKFLAVSILSFILSSCSKNTYILNTPNVSFFEKKGEMEIQLNGNYRSFQPQWAMSISNKFLYQVNGHIGFLGQKYGEGLVGYFLSRKKFKFELLTGAGYGKLDFLNGDYGVPFGGTTSITVFSNYLKIPIVANIGFQEGKTKYFFSSRISFVNYYNYNYYYELYHYNTPGPGGLFDSESAHEKNITGLIWDVGIGVKTKRTIFNIGTSLNSFIIPYYEEKKNTYNYANRILSSGTENKTLMYTPFYISFGFLIHFPKEDELCDY